MLPIRDARAARLVRPPRLGPPVRVPLAHDEGEQADEEKTVATRSARLVVMASAPRIAPLGTPR